MATKTFATLAAKIAPSVPGCPKPLIIDSIRDAAIRACEDTLLWRYAEPPFQLRPGAHEVFFRKPQETEVHVIFRAIVDGRILNRVRLEEAIDMFPDWADLYNGLTSVELWSLVEPDTLNAEEYNELLFAGSLDIELPPEATEGGNIPTTITQLGPDKYVVLPMPDQARVYMLRMIYALKPSKIATGMDETIMNELEYPIIHQALQQLLVMPGVTWADRTLATYHAKQYLFRATERRARANLGNARASLTVRHPGFA